MTIAYSGLRIGRWIVVVESWAAGCSRIAWDAEGL
jgi:hypothetical protein